MYLEKKFISNYLSRVHYPNAPLFSFLWIAISFILSLFYWDNSYHFTQYLSANALQVFSEQEYWRLITTSLIHADIHHFLSNSLMLFILLYFVMAYFGLYQSLFAVVMSAVTNALTLSFYHHETTLVGASGIIYYLWGFWFILYLFLATQLSLIGRLIRVFGIFLILLVPTNYVPQTSYLAHYLGFLVGIVSGLILYIFKAKFFKNYEHYVEVEVEDYHNDESIKLDTTMSD